MTAAILPGAARPGSGLGWAGAGGGGAGRGGGGGLRVRTFRQTRTRLLFPRTFLTTYLQRFLRAMVGVDWCAAGTAGAADVAETSIAIATGSIKDVRKKRRCAIGPFSRTVDLSTVARPDGLRVTENRELLPCACLDRRRG